MYVAVGGTPKGRPYTSASEYTLSLDWAPVAGRWPLGRCVNRLFLPIPYQRKFVIFTNFITGSTGITGWTVVGPEASIVSGSYASLGFTFPAEDGKQWLDLTGDGTNSVEGVKQTFATTPGTTYNLSYFVGNQANPGGIWGTTSTVNVMVNGVLIQELKDLAESGQRPVTGDQQNPPPGVFDKE
jgi:hypothetical protein